MTLHVTMVIYFDKTLSNVHYEYYSMLTVPSTTPIGMYATYVATENLSTLFRQSATECKSIPFHYNPL